MVYIGIDMWQGMLPQNEISAIHNEVYGRLHLTGSLDAAIMDYADFDEAVIWAEVQRASGSTVPGGSFIPCLTYDGEGSIKLQSAQSR